MTRTGKFVNPGFVNNALGGNALDTLYSGPVYMPLVKDPSIGGNYNGTVSANMNESSMNADGATAISQVAPTNPTASLATGLAETVREGFPSLPGIQTWKKRTEYLKSLGSEYLNYQFGWAPLHKEVTDVVNAARHHRDIMQNYRHNEGSNVHRRFDFPLEKQRWVGSDFEANPTATLDTTFYVAGASAKCRTVVEKQRKRWFSGCFTYGGPSGTDSFRKSLGFGSEADAVYGLELTPDVLWELTPWSWAVDWFSNTGDVINNVTNFALAGLVMRYGYMMEETIYSYYTEWDDPVILHTHNYSAGQKARYTSREGSGSCGEFTVTKSRAPANPFGFGVGWEGLSPTQLAITAAIGITRLL